MLKKDRTGEKKIAKNGMEMEIVEYINYRNITIRFADGYTKHTDLKSWNNGMIKNPNLIDTRISQNKKHIGEEKLMHCGLVAKIIEYNSTNDISVEFEDGTIISHTTYGYFKKGSITHPNISYRDKNLQTQKKVWEGKTVKTALGEEITLIKYNKHDDIAVKFKDGTIVEHCFLDSFKKGQIRNPNAENPRVTKIKEERVGQKKENNEGFLAKIIDYKNTDEVFIKFERDGEIIKVRWKTWCKGNFSHPNGKKYKYEGMQIRQKNGLDAVCTRYINSEKIIIRFEDGLEKEARRTNFINRELKHPQLARVRVNNFHNILAQFAFEENNNVFYKCRCQNCGLENIMTPQQMLEHIKIHEISINEPTTQK